MNSRRILEGRRGGGGRGGGTEDREGGGGGEGGNYASRALTDVALQMRVTLHTCE